MPGLQEIEAGHGAPLLWQLPGEARNISYGVPALADSLVQLGISSSHDCTPRHTHCEMITEWSIIVGAYDSLSWSGDVHLLVSTLVFRH